ncbi:hypothetical protein EV421DRAFT_1477934 [Armillaria borealis]|uniref:F-box domain-containing protein n=1 Tax=Armillaria borealis TaxID=47425 RepID=A0AA39MVK9_9AGAR|nr:hypothetical protein EV421DRAFT_1477934 [Armillaria borealis]
MLPQELVDRILDHLYKSPSALKACSQVSRAFYPRTRVHLFRCVNCHDPDDPRLFKMARESPELLQHIKRVEFQCLDYFLPNYEMPTIELMRSLSSSATLSLWDEGRRNDKGEKECRWVDMLPTFVSSAPYLAITRLELLCPQLHNFLELHTVVLSLPNMTELSIDVLTMDDVLTPIHPNMLPVPRIKKMRIHALCFLISEFWDGLSSPKYRPVYLDHLEELYVLRPAPSELSLVNNIISFTSKSLKVLHIECEQRHWTLPRSSDITIGGHGLPPDTSPLHLNTVTDLRLGVILDKQALSFIDWWIKSFKAMSPLILERLTIGLGGPFHDVLKEPERLKKTFEELSDVLSKLVRNVDIVFQLHCPFRDVVMEALKEKENLRVFDLVENTREVPAFPVFPLPTGS